VPPEGLPLGYSKAVGFTLASPILDWVPLGALIACFVLTFFTWVGAYPGGYPVFTQSAWSILGADLSGIAPTEDLQKTSDWLEKNANGLETDWLILPYLLLLIVTIVLAIIERVFKNPSILNIPGPLAWVPTIWPRRFALLTILTVILLLFLSAHIARGRALPGAMRRYVTELHKAEVEAADTNTKKMMIQVKMGQEFGKYAIQSTTYRSLVVWSHLLAVVGMGLRWWLHRRFPKPAPRISIQL
jgi:hypothetical protein